MGSDGGFWEPVGSVAQAGVLTLALTIYAVVELWGGPFPDGPLLVSVAALVVGVTLGAAYAYFDTSLLATDPLDEYVFLVTVLAVGLAVASILSPVGVPGAVSVVVLAFLWSSYRTLVGA
jgi:NhaP-type Na+/H+ and K+/H+ antiporter